MSQEEKQPFQDEATARSKVYKEKLAVYHQTEDYTNYQKALKDARKAAKPKKTKKKKKAKKKRKSKKNKKAKRGRPKKPRVDDTTTTDEIENGSDPNYIPGKSD